MLSDLFRTYSLSLFFIFFSCLEIQAQYSRKFNYGGNNGDKFRGVVYIDFHLKEPNGKEIHLNQLSRGGLIDLNAVDSNALIKVTVRDLSLGLAKDYRKTRQKDHRNKFYLELVDVSQSGAGVRLKEPYSKKVGTLSSVTGVKRSVVLSYQLKHSEIIAQVGGTLELGFQIVEASANNRWGGQNIRQKYTIQPRKLSIREQDEISASKLYNSVMNESDTNKVLLNGGMFLKRYPRINKVWSENIKLKVENYKPPEPKKIAADSLLWRDIQLALIAGQDEQVYSLSKNYIEKFPDRANIEEAYQLAFDRAVNPEERDNIQLMYADRFPNRPELVGSTGAKFLDIESEEDLSEEERSWRSAKRENTIEAYRKYVEEYEEGEYLEKALDAMDRLIPFSVQYHRLQNNEYQLTFEGTGGIRPEITFTQPEAKIKEWIGDDQVLVILPEGKTTTMGIAYRGETTYLDIDANQIPLAGSFLVSENKIGVSGITGGIPPYYLIFESAGVPIAEEQLGSSSKVEIDADKLIRDKRLSAGKYTLVLTDRRKMERIEKSDVVISKPADSSSSTMWGLLVGVVLLIGGGYYFYQKTQNSNKIDQAKAREFDEILRQRQRQSYGQADVSQNPSGARSKIKIKSARSKIAIASEPVLPEEQIGVEEESEIIVEEPAIPPSPPPRERVENISNDNSAPPVVPEAGMDQEYFHLPITTVWPESVIKQLAMHRNLAFAIEDDISKLVREANFNADANHGTLGFLLGKTELDHQNARYHVRLERLIEIKPEVENGKIQFGLPAWAELDSKLDQFSTENLSLLGWFKATIGDDLALTQEEVIFHNNFFPKNSHLILNVIANDDDQHQFCIYPRNQSGHLLKNISGRQQILPWSGVSNWLRG